MNPVVLRRRKPEFLAVMLLAAALFFSHAYTGIRHDGILYAGDALARLAPGQFGQDLYFLFGSQGQYTILPTLYAQLISLLGLGTGTMVGMLAAAVLYLGATWYFVGAFANERLRFYCALAVVLGWSIYGGQRIFAYAEPFLTARSFAEPAVLIGLSLLYRGRHVAAFLALLIGAGFHPLLAASGFIVFWFVQVQSDRRWLWALPAAAIALALLGWLRIGPFADVFAAYDANWLALVQDSNPQAFVEQWSMLDYGVVVFDTVSLILAARRVGDRRLARFVRACLYAGLAATLASFVLVDIGHSVFFGKLQIWRALWIMQWVAIATLPLTFVALWKSGEHGRVAALFMAIGSMASFSAAPAAVALIALAIDHFRGRVEISRDLTRTVLGVTILTACVIVVQHEMRVITLGDLLDQPLRSIVGQALAINVLLFVAIAGLWKVTPRYTRVAPFVFGVMLVVALSLWDQRAAWTRTLESYPVGTHIWPGLIERDAKVYWYRDLIAPWILLGHGNYYSPQQGSGAVFSRDMMIELERRRKLTALLEFQEQVCRLMNSLSEKQGVCEPDAQAVSTVCIDGGIDYVVLQSGLEGAAPIAELSTGVVENGYEKKFFLYRCSALQKG